jgi:hypothetical protein
MTVGKMLQDKENQKRQGKVDVVQAKYGPWLSQAGANAMNATQLNSMDTINDGVSNIIAENEEAGKFQRMKDMYERQKYQSQMKKQHADKPQYLANAEKDIPLDQLTPEQIMKGYF